MKANQRKGSDGSPVVSLDGIDSSSVHSADLVTTTTCSSTSSPEPYVATTPNLNRALFSGMISDKCSLQVMIVNHLP